jgi:hypothetical protein
MNAPARGHRFRLARLGWYPAAALALVILFAAIPGYRFPPGISEFEGWLVFERSPLTATFEAAAYLASLLAAALSLGFAALLFVKKPGDRMALFLAYYLLAHGISFAGPIEMLQPFWPEAQRVNTNFLLPTFMGPASLALIGLFPDGRWVPRWSAWLVPGSAILVPLVAAVGGGALPILPGAQPLNLAAAAFILWGSFMAGGATRNFTVTGGSPRPSSACKPCGCCMAWRCGSR